MLIIRKQELRNILKQTKTEDLYFILGMVQTEVQLRLKRAKINEED